METRHGRASWRALFAAALVASLCGCRERVEERVVQEIAQSHVDANVPQPDDFDRFLRRDLQAYLESAGYRPIRIHYELLRDGPTQAGTAYPKFYVWLQADTGEGAFTGAVARLAAVEKKEFQVTDLMLISDLRQNPDRVWDTFPAPVSREILDRIAMADVRQVRGR